MTSLATSLAESLEESKEYSAAATIQLEYLSDVDAAAQSLCKGHHFPEAIRIVSLHARQNLLKDVIDPGLGEGFATLTELLAECKGQLKAQVPRLIELREVKARDPRKCQLLPFSTTIDTLFLTPNVEFDTCSCLSSWFLR